MGKRSTKQRLIGFCTAMLLVVCSAAQANLQQKDEIAVRVIQRGAAKVVDASAVRLGEALVIKGRVERLFPSQIRGHLDFAAYGKDGELIEKASIKHRNVSRKGGKSSVPFTAQLPDSANAARVVYIAYHGMPHRDGKPSGCNENAAVSGS